MRGHPIAAANPAASSKCWNDSRKVCSSLRNSTGKSIIDGRTCSSSSSARVFAAPSLTADGHAGKSYSVVGSTPLTGPYAAGVWSKALGRPVNYPNLSPEAFEKQVRQFLPPWPPR